MYRLLVGLHGADAESVAAELGLDRRRTESLLTSLQEKGLVSGPEQRPGGGGTSCPWRRTWRSGRGCCAGMRRWSGPGAG